MSNMNWERPNIQPKHRTLLRNVRIEPGTKYLISGHDDTPCSVCHWPIAKNSTMDMSVVQGVRTYKHRKCPTLAERRLLRQQSVNA